MSLSQTSLFNQIYSCMSVIFRVRREYTMFFKKKFLIWISFSHRQFICHTVSLLWLATSTRHIILVWRQGVCVPGMVLQISKNSLEHECEDCAKSNCVRFAFVPIPDCVLQWVWLVQWVKAFSTISCEWNLLHLSVLVLEVVNLL